MKVSKWEVEESRRVDIDDNDDDEVEEEEEESVPLAALFNGIAEDDEDDEDYEEFDPTVGEDVECFLRIISL